MKSGFYLEWHTFKIKCNQKITCHNDWRFKIHDFMCLHVGLCVEKPMNFIKNTRLFNFGDVKFCSNVVLSEKYSLSAYHSHLPVCVVYLYLFC